MGRDLAIEAFATDHVVPSLGFHLLRRRRKLKEEFRALSGASSPALRADRVAIEGDSEELWLSYCGDTGPEVWRLAPRLPQSRLLIIECTFLGDEVRQHGSAYKHLHFDDLVEHEADLAAHEAIVLHHLSRRHSTAELRARWKRGCRGSRRESICSARRTLDGSRQRQRTGPMSSVRGDS